MKPALPSCPAPVWVLGLKSAPWPLRQDRSTYTSRKIAARLSLDQSLPKNRATQDFIARAIQICLSRTRCTLSLQEFQRLRSQCQVNAVSVAISALERYVAWRGTVGCDHIMMVVMGLPVQYSAESHLALTQRRACCGSPETHSKTRSFEKQAAATGSCTRAGLCLTERCMRRARSR